MKVQKEIVCTCDDLAILADASDSVNVNHDLEIV